MVATPKMMVIFHRDEPQKATTAMTATMAGKANSTKDPALRATSSRPPLYPDTRPSVPPTANPMITETNPTISDTRAP